MLMLNNRDLMSCLDMAGCIDSLYEGIKMYVRHDAVRRPRMDHFIPTSRPDEFACFSSMEGAIRDGYYAIRIKPDIVSWPVVNGVKRRMTYCYQPGLYGGLVLLFRIANAELVAIMNDGCLQHMRVGATAALGAKYLARQDAQTVGMLGSGGMARSFALGFAAVRSLRIIKVYSPNSERLNAYCREMSEALNIEVKGMPSPEEAIKGSDIVASCTNSLEPVVKGRWLEPGMYLANVATRELDPEVFRRISLVGRLIPELDASGVSVFSDRDLEIRDGVMSYIAGQPLERERIPAGRQSAAAMANARWVPCVNWDTENPRGRESDEDISLLLELSAGNAPAGWSSGDIKGLQFASIAGRAYESASSRGLGQSLDIHQFLQDIPT
jgi:ornithine cyclodeaminase/alanine dehydrogenase-like protein (mu-crystallin family)